MTLHRARGTGLTQGAWRYAGRMLALVPALLVLLLLGPAGCATYAERVAPVPLPDHQPNRVEVSGIKLIAESYLGRDAAKQAFGFDIRGAGLLPIRFVIDNPTPYEVQVIPEQTFLLDAEGQAWPLLSAEQASSRVSDHVELGETARGAVRPAALLGAAGALAGFAIAVLSGNDLGKGAAKGAAVGASAGAIFGGASRHQELEPEIEHDLARQSLRNRKVGPGELAYGYLFFPGREEAQTTRALRLGLDIGGRSEIVELPL